MVKYGKSYRNDSSVALERFAVFQVCYHCIILCVITKASGQLVGYFRTEGDFRTRGFQYDGVLVLNVEKN